jgi:hypothetical protein
MKTGATAFGLGSDVVVVAEGHSVSASIQQAQLVAPKLDEVEPAPVRLTLSKVAATRVSQFASSPHLFDQATFAVLQGAGIEPANTVSQAVALF